MATSFGEFGLSQALSGTNWPITVQPWSTGDVHFAFVFASTHLGSTTPTMSGWTQHGGLAETTGMQNSLYVFRRARTDSSASATSETLSWSGPGAQGFAWCVTATDAQVDVTGAPSADLTFPTSRTASAINTTSGGARVDVLLTREYRTTTTTGGVLNTRPQYGGGASGGIGGSVRYLTGTATGSTAGPTFTYVDPNAGAADSQSILFSFSLKPAAVGAGNPTLSGIGTMADATASATPDTPAVAPAVAATSATSVNITLSGWDASADTIKVIAQEFIGNMPQNPVEVLSFPTTPAPTFPKAVTGLKAGGVYRFFWYVVEAGVNSLGNSPASPTITLSNLVARMLVDPTAVGITNVDVQVWLNPVPPRFAGDFVTFQQGLSFKPTLQSGQAVLDIPLSGYTGTLTVGQPLVAVARKVVTGNEIWTRITAATVTSG